MATVRMCKIRGLDTDAMVLLTRGCRDEKGLGLLRANFVLPDGTSLHAEHVKTTASACLLGPSFTHATAWYVLDSGRRQFPRWDGYERKQ